MSKADAGEPNIPFLPPEGTDSAEAAVFALLLGYTRMNGPEVGSRRDFATKIVQAVLDNLPSVSERLTTAEALCRIVDSLDTAGDGCDCGRAFHGMSGAEHGGCTYCEALAAWRSLTKATDD